MLHAYATELAGRMETIRKEPGVPGKSVWNKPLFNCGGCACTLYAFDPGS